MKFQKIIVVFIFLLLILGPSIQTNATNWGGFVDSVPMLPSQERFAIVNVEINGHGPFRLILDTGSSELALKSDALKRLSLKPVGDDYQNSAEGTEIKKVNYGIVQVSIGNASTKTSCCDMLDDYDSDSDGIIGGSLFEKYTIWLDFTESKVNFYTPKAVPPADGYVGLFIGVDNRYCPFVLGTINNHATIFRVDTGCNMPLMATTLETSQIVQSGKILATGSGYTTSGVVGIELHQIDSAAFSIFSLVNSCAVPSPIQDDNEHFGCRIGITSLLKNDPVFQFAYYQMYLKVVSSSGPGLTK